MANTNTTNSVLDHLSPAAQEAVRAEVRAELAAELAGGVVSTPEPAPAPARAAKTTTAKKPKPGRKAKAKPSGTVETQGTGRGARQSNDQYSSASEFIRSLPMDMKAREVIELGAEQGFTISHALVSNTRRRVQESEGKAPAKRGRKSKAEKAETKSAAQGKGSQGPRQKTKSGLTAAAFVRDLDEKREAKGQEQLSAKEVVERGHKAGLTSMKEHTVHNTRKNVRQKAAKEAAQARGKKAAATRAANKAKKPAGKKAS